MPSKERAAHGLSPADEVGCEERPAIVSACMSGWKYRSQAREDPPRLMTMSLFP
jgi:hypothetical protein